LIRLVGNNPINQTPPTYSTHPFMASHVLIYYACRFKRRSITKRCTPTFFVVWFSSMRRSFPAMS
jgi:hypothetical protein